MARHLFRATIALAIFLSAQARALDSNIFSVSYDESRAQFRQSCQKAAVKHGGRCQTYAIKSQVDSDLTVDYGYFSKHGSRLVVIQSGIHGPETPAGAAVQQLVFEKYLDRLLDRGIDVLIIHAINPYGYKYSRRTDEFNVNLNRNFAADAGVYASKNTAYNDLRSMFEPIGPVNCINGDSLISDLKFVWAYIWSKFDKRYINQGMNSGQYEFERGLNYGGRINSQQMTFLREILPPIFKKYSGQILYLDFHTGLGENGVLQIMNGLKPATAFLAQVTGYWGSFATQGIKMTNANDPNDPNFYTDQGDVIDYIPTLAPNPEMVLALTMEYGTMGVDTQSQLKSASRIILENEAHFYGCSSENACKVVQDDFRDLFNPPDIKWRKMVVDEADKVFSVIVDKY